MADKCPRCQKEVESLVGVDSGFRNRVNLTGNTQIIPDKICGSCYQELGATITQTGIFSAKERFKESAKIALWKGRIGLLRKARNHMKKKVYGEAVASYEKYLKVLEAIFEKKLEDLTPDVFKEKAATKELTVACSVFWDLIRIYDTNEKYKSKQMLVAQKLAQFAPYTPMLVEMIRQAEAFKRKARNGDVINKLLRQLANRRARCFIASSAFNDVLAPEVIFLQNWRDQVLLKNKVGMISIEIYYTISPPLAQVLDRLSILKPAVRLFLNFLIFCISKMSLKSLPTRVSSKTL
jgi:hypothetical protein